MSVTKKNKYIINALLILVLIIILRPTKEYMICNQDLQCSVTHEFISIIKIPEKFEIKPSTKMDSFTLYLGRKDRRIYITLDKIPHFISGNFSDYEYSGEILLNKELKNFDDYKQGNIKEYQAEGYANPFGSYLLIFIYLLFAIPITYVLVDDK